MKRKKLFKNILRYLVLCLVGVLIGVGIFTSVTANVRNELAMPFGVGTAVVMSGSMEPDMSVGDLVLVVKTDDYSIGEDVVFQSGTSRVVHRIYKIENGEYTTVGIANNKEDDPISREFIYGEVVLVIPYVGTFIEVLKDPLVTLCLGATAIVLLEASIRREKEKENGKLDSIKKEISRLKSEGCENSSKTSKM